MRNLLAGAEQDFADADAAFKAGKVGQYVSLLEAGRLKVDQAIAILNENNGNGDPTDQPTDEPTDGASSGATDEPTSTPSP